VATGFQMPVNIAFVPSPGASLDSPLYYVAELYEIIKVVRRNGVISDYATGLINYNPTGSLTARARKAWRASSWTPPTRTFSPPRCSRPIF